MQPLASGAALAAYHARLKSSHDFSIELDILNLNEQQVGSATLLDGQVNIQADDLVRRTATLTISDVAGALDFSNSSAYNRTGLWVNRLVRVRHMLDVPGYGTLTAIPFIGPVTGMSRQGAEVQATCSDKAFLSSHGTRPFTVAKGTLATAAIRAIMVHSTGEFRFRIPTYSRKLSKNYSVGLADEANPMQVAVNIAKNELGMQLLYSCDGYLMLRPIPTAPVVDIGSVTDQASTSADFSAIKNYVFVSGKSVSKKKGNVTVTTQVTSSVQTGPTSNLSPVNLTRQGVGILLPLVINEDAYTTTAQTSARALAELNRVSNATEDLSASVVPMFHLDADDRMTVHADGGSKVMTLTEGSIPLGVGGDMTLGFHRWVSRPALTKPKPKVVRTVKHAKKKGRKKRHHGKVHH